MDQSTLEPNEAQRTDAAAPVETTPPPAPFEPSNRIFYFGVSLTAFFLIFYETVAFQVLIFISNYMRAIQILAIALLGCAVGGLLAFALRKRASMLFYAKVAMTLPITIGLSFASVCLFPSWPWFYSIGVMLPFVASALLISLSFSLASSHRVYFYDLTGAAVGALAACVSVPLYREEGSLMLLAVLGLGIALIFASQVKSAQADRLRKTARYAMVVILAVFTANVVGDFINMTWFVRPSNDRYKIFSFWHKNHSWFLQKPNKRFRHRIARGSLVERIDMVRIKGRYNTYYNGYANDHVSSTPVGNFTRDRRLPHGLVKDPDVMVIGTAAEGITKTARGLGNGDVVGLEINPAIIDIMLHTQIYQYSKQAYDDIELHAIDARSYLKRTDRKFNIVTMMNTHRLRNIGYAGQPEYLHTIESLNDILDHLEDEGWIVLEERDMTNAARLGIHRFLQNAKYVLESRPDIQDPKQHFWVYGWYGLGIKNRYNLYTQILIKKTPINEKDIANIRAWIAMQEKRKIQGKRPDHGVFNHYLPGEQSGHIIERMILADSPYEIYDPKKYNFDPITDDRPFPFDVNKDRHHLRAMMKTIIPLTLILGLLPVIVLLVLFRRESRGRPAGIIFSGSAVAYFSLLGIGYLLLEVVLIQRLSMFIGMPVLTLAVVLATMLFFSGLGSYLSRNWTLGKQIAAFVGILVLGLSIHSLLDVFINACIFLPVWVRAVLVALFLAPLALLMGTPFPFGMKLAKIRLGDRFGAAMFGLNGAFSALATPLALTWGTIFGFRQAFILGSVVYLACGLLALILWWKAGTDRAESAS